MTSFADRMHAEPDERILDRAAQPRRALFTMDEDFFAEAAARRRRGESFACIVYAHPERSKVAELIECLVLVAEVYSYEEAEGQVIFLPFRSAG